MTILGKSIFLGKSILGHEGRALLQHKEEFT